MGQSTKLICLILFFADRLTLLSSGLAFFAVEKPTPYAPDYAPECDLIVPGLKKEEVLQPLASGALQYLANYIPRSVFYCRLSIRDYNNLAVNWVKYLTILVKRQIKIPFTIN